MPVQVVCPKCRKSLSVGDDRLSGGARCPACGASFRLSLSDGGGKRSTVGPAAGSQSDRERPSSRPPSGPGEVPASIGPYEVSAELGRGAFGVVYRAHDAQLGRDVAIKVLNRDALASAKALERFLREARVVAQMHHNHVVPVFLLGEQDGAHYIVSKFIAGQTLSEAVIEEGMEPGRAAVLVIQLLEALAYAHDLDVLHRDVKPANAILDANGQLFLMDFGLAGWVGQETGRMTQDGSVMGTPSYMAPEQARGDIRHVGPAADQYSAGVVLYELLTGHLPFEGGAAQVVLYNILNTPPPPPSEWRDDLDPALEEICLKAIAKLPEERYPTCRDFADALRQWQRTGAAPAVVFEPVDEEAPAPPKRASRSGDSQAKAGRAAGGVPAPSRRGGEGTDGTPVWHYTDDRGKKVGPVTREQLLALFREGAIEAKTLVWNPSLPKWVPLKSVPGLLDRSSTAARKRAGSLNWLALASLAAAVLWLCGLGSAAGVVFGFVALRQMRTRKGLRGRALALSGIVVGGAGLTLTAGFFLVLYFPSVGPSTHSPDQIAAEYRDKVYRVEYSDAKFTHTGSGVLLANDSRRGLIATNLHVVDSELINDTVKSAARKLLPESSITKKWTVDVSNSSQLHAKKANVAAFHRDLDLALLVIEMDSASPDAVRVARQDSIRDGEAAVAMGYPLGVQLNTTPGIISNRRGEEGKVWTTCPISPGNSGGPLFLERRGLLAGLNTESFVKGQNFNGAVPAEQIVSALREGRTDNWVWEPELREDVVKLAAKVTLED